VRTVLRDLQRLLTRRWVVSKRSKCILFVILCLPSVIALPLMFFPPPNYYSSSDTVNIWALDVLIVLHPTQLLVSVLLFATAPHLGVMTSPPDCDSGTPPTRSRSGVLHGITRIAAAIFKTAVGAAVGVAAYAVWIIAFGYLVAIVGGFVSLVFGSP